jgi:ABC-type nickel/cobalt efflux system permease component RcnA
MIIPSIWTVAGISLLLGLRHAFEPDHLAAVSTLATRQGRLWDASRLGVAWGLGHTASIAVVALVMIAGGLHLPEKLWPAADFLVGVLLIVLGGAVIRRYAMGRWHLHAHSHDGAAHLHLHSHASDSTHAHAHRAPDVRRSLGFGLLHGLAGSGAIVVLLVASVPTRGAQLAYVAAFGVGTVLGMVAVSLSLGAAVRYASRRGERWATVLHLGSAAMSVTVGAALAWEMAARL